MDADKIISGIARDMRKFCLIGEDQIDMVKFFIKLGFVAGIEYNPSKKPYTKEVIRCTLDGTEIERYESGRKAEKELKLKRDFVHRAIKFKRHTRNGNIWKFAEAEDNDRHQDT